jgi:hypothetical protein
VGAAATCVATGAVAAAATGAAIIDTSMGSVTMPLLLRGGRLNGTGARIVVPPWVPATPSRLPIKSWLSVWALLLFGAADCSAVEAAGRAAARGVAVEEGSIMRGEIK